MTKPNNLLVLWLAMLSLAVFSCKESRIEEEGEREEKEKKEHAARFLKGRVEYEVTMLKDPATGKVPVGIFEKESRFALTIPTREEGRGGGIQVLNNYLPAGPNNMGGRTRALAYDVRYDGAGNRIVIAGCVSGGIMRSADGGITWTLVTPQNDIHNLSALAQDPRPGFQNTWYAGTGEFIGNSASTNGAPYLGYGLWKSIDNGLTWNRLPMAITDNVTGGLIQNNTLEVFDHPFDFIYRIAVNPVNGDVYIASFRRVVRSTNGGASFQAVFGNNSATNAAVGQYEVAVTNTGRVLLGVNGGNPDPSLRGVWISNTGDANSYTRIAGGQTVGVDSVTGWRGNAPNNSSRRIVMTLAPSNNNIAYIFYENGLSQSSPTLQPEADLFRLDISGNSFTWSNRSANMPDFPGGNADGSDPLEVQGGYNMMVRVKPDDPNTVFIGGTNLYRSTDGFTTTANTAWIGGYRTNFTYGLYPGSHPDIHELAFNPTNPNEAICANDGGLQKTTNALANPMSWLTPANYQTLQYYYVAIDPDAGRNNFAGGSQDNGVRFRDRTGIFGTQPADSNNHILFISGDGAAVGISKVDPLNQIQYLYGGLQLGLIYRQRLTPGVDAVNIRPNGLTPNPAYGAPYYGEFVTNFRLHPENTEDLYYINFNRLFRTISASSVSAGGWTELTGVATAIGGSGGSNSIRGMAFSRGPYNTTHALYLGTTSGKIFRLDDPRNFDPAAAPVDITPAGLVGNVQDIAVNPNDDNEVMAVVSNYGTSSGGQLVNITNIWWTANAKSGAPTWRQAEGNLSAGFISGRSCQIVVKKDAGGTPVTEYYVGTGAGLFSTVNLGTVLQGGGSPTWQREGASQLNLAVIQHMAYRPADNVLVIGTHGNGMYFSYLGTPNFTPPLGTSTGPVINDRNFIRQVYPTVSQGMIQYQTGNMTGIRKIRIEVSDMNGRLVYTRDAAYGNGNIGVEALARGSYVLTITSEDRKNRFVQKIIRQ